MSRETESEQTCGTFLVLLITLAATAAVVWQLLRMGTRRISQVRKVCCGYPACPERSDRAYLAFLRDGATLFAGDREPTCRSFAHMCPAQSEEQYPDRRLSDAIFGNPYPGILVMG